MHKLIFASTTIALLILIPAFASGEVYIPDHEYVGFYDHDGIFTVIGGVKNNEMYPVIPTITVSVNDGGNVFSQEYKFSPVMPAQMLPLKLKLPQITSENPVLEPPQISYTRTEYKFEGGYVLYDNSLILHDDGSMTGKIKNAGDNTFQNFRVYALIKDQNEKILDVASSQRFAIMHPGEILEFEMIPNPKIVNKIDLYSCFAFGDESILPLNADRNGEQYTFRYESGVAFMNSKFNSDSTELEIDTLNSFVGELNASFEFPQSSINEEFEVYLDDDKVSNLQSLDEMGNWHVYFTVPGFFQGDVTIKGFHEPDGTVEVPEEIDLSNTVATEITTGQVTSIIAKTAKNSIVISLETAEDGVLSVTTSDFLIRPFNDGGFLVVADGEKIHSVKYENKILTIPYTAQTEKIEVYGSYVIPEFGTIAIIVLAVAVVSIIALSRKNSISYSLSNV
ncbi:PEFG-CTERM sorting domain-containing protein [Marine Group I thaumarchaeote]|uniref:PEFG-CTERM sorting domain-containing protein n=1 Tax=Marine Group I thaumarchaeote TaxID=2511932 RepID=A0A7K4MQI7_9ARCH|nr:PEFG-CTERM sorting domain-containing protein [Marine Group I thaumarchaeote]